ncbi:Serine incorporator (Serinc) [Phytophthora infestans]|uniref:Serine incorporator (Serinc) n=1 Tax=Phytophthora infestans TaxID=4787 RepID=A0A833SXL3_PHYIN|nr:Serine incorporator (Serinc) [Phytophthora infestans]
MYSFADPDQVRDTLLSTIESAEKAAENHIDKGLCAGSEDGIFRASALILVCITSWLEVGLLPPCTISAYLVLMCWQALVSNPDKNCEHRDHTPEDEEAANKNSMVANAVVAAFAMTWTSWRTSSAAANLLARQAREPSKGGSLAARPSNNNDQFTAVVVIPAQRSHETPDIAPAVSTVETTQPNLELIHEPWQFYSMMCLAGLYMAMVLTDWDSADG